MSIWISDVFGSVSRCYLLQDAVLDSIAPGVWRVNLWVTFGIICGLQIIFPSSFMSKVCVDNMTLFKIWHIHQILCAHTHSIYPQHFHRTVLIQAIWLPLEILYFLQINIYSWRERNAHFERFSRRPEYLPADLTTTTQEQSAYMNINLRRVNEHYTYNA